MAEFAGSPVEWISTPIKATVSHEEGADMEAAATPITSVAHKKVDAFPLHVTPREEMAKRKKAMVWRKWSIRLLGFLYHLSITVLITTMPELILLGSRNNFSKTASFLGMCSGIERGLQFFSMPALGKVSDAYGRKPVLLVSLLGHLASLILLIAMPSATTIMVYYCINGLLNATYTIAHTMVTDLTLAVTPTEGALAQQYGRFGMAVGLSLVIGPAVGPSLSTINVLLPVWAALGCIALCVVLWFFMEESLAPEARMSFSFWDCGPFKNIWQACKNRRFVQFVVPFFITQIAESIYHFMIIYTKKRFHWSFIELGLYVASMGVAIASVQGALKYVIPKYLSEGRAVVLGLAAHTVSLLVISFSNKGWMLILVVVPQMMASLKQPGLMSLISGTAPSSEQGILQGSVQSIRVVAKAMGSPIFGALLSFAMRDDVVARNGPAVQGLPFLIGAIMDALSLVVTMYVLSLGIASSPKGDKALELQNAKTASPSMVEEEEEPTAAG